MDLLPPSGQDDPESPEGPSMSPGDSSFEDDGDGGMCDLPPIDMEEPQTHPTGWPGRVRFFANCIAELGRRIIAGITNH